MNKLFSVILLVLVLVVPVSASARGPERRVLVTEFAGDDAEGVRAGVLRALARRKKVRVVSLQHAFDLAVDLDANLGKPAGAIKVARALGLTALIRGEVKQHKGAVEATLRVVAPSGKVVETRRVRESSMEALHARLERTTWQLLGRAIRELPAKKDGGVPRVVLTQFDGAESKRVRGWVANALERQSELALVPDKELPRDLAASATDATEEDAVRIAQTVNATLVVFGETTRQGKKHHTRIKLLSGSDGGVLGEYEYDAPLLVGVKAKIDRDLSSNIQPALSLAKAPMPPRESVPDSEVEADQGNVPAVESPGAASSGRDPLRATLGAGVFGRHFHYTGVSDPTLRGYDLNAAPMHTLSLRWFPGAHFTEGVAGNLGVDGRFDRAVLLDSRAADGSAASTRAIHWTAQGVFRVPLSAHEVGFALGFGQDEFAIESVDATALLPNVKYSFVRTGAELRLVFGAFAFGAAAGIRALTGVGAVGDPGWFPDSSGFGVDASLSAEWEMVRSLRAVVGGDYRRYGLSLGSSSTPRADSAVDEYPTGWAGLRWMP